MKLCSLIFHAFYIEPLLLSVHVVHFYELFGLPFPFQWHVSHPMHASACAFLARLGAPTMLGIRKHSKVVDNRYQLL